MATTAEGLPYPVGSDLVKDGDNAIKALADALELRNHGLMVQSGSVVVQLNPQGDATWTFPKAFKTGTVPVLVVNNGDPNSSGTAIVSSFFQYTNNTTGAIRWRNPDGSSPSAGSNVRIQYIAIGTAP